MTVWQKVAKISREQQFLWVAVQAPAQIVILGWKNRLHSAAHKENKKILQVENVPIKTPEGSQKRKDVPYLNFFFHGVCHESSV